MKMKRVVSAFLAVALMLGLAGCSGTSWKLTGKSLTLWAEASTVKIKQQDQGEAAKGAGDKDKLQIHMAKNESEGVQLMMYAKQDVAAYDVVVSDLKSEETVIPADDIDVYMLKYQTVEYLQATANDAFPIGTRVPDPMLPMKTAVEYKENTVEKGNNQAIYFDVSTTVDTKPGVYEGAVTLKTENETYKVPMEVTVYDVELPDTPELKTAFSYFDRDHFASAELDASDEITTTYMETLMEYNMGSALPFEGDGGVEKYIELLRKYYNQPGFTSYRVFYDPSGSIYEGVECSYNAPLLKEYVKAIGQASVEDKINYFEKAYCYFYTVADEPVTEEQFLTAQAALNVYKTVLADSDAELRYQYSGTEQYKYYIETISKSLIELPNILPGHIITEEMEKYDIEELTMVPLISNFQTEANRKRATAGREDKELWTYTCNFPVYPYPSNHTDDWCLGFRLTSWMCCDYEWDGFLQWRSVGYIYGTVGSGNVADPWETMNSDAGRPGDGVFFYPGAKYGLDSPCPSLRAMAYRDGTEDYSILKVVEQIYEDAGLDARYALSDIYSQVYSGVIPITDSYVFEDVRLQLFDLIADLRSNTGILYKSVTINFDSAEIIFKCVDEQATVKVDGKEMNADEAGFIRVDIDMAKQSDCEIQVTNGKEENTYVKRLIDGKVGAMCGFEDSKETADYVLISNKGSDALINADTAYVKDGASSLGLTLNKEKADVIPYFGIDKDSTLIGGSWRDIVSMKFYVYNASKEDINMEAAYFTTSEISVDTFLLTAGEWTMVEVAMPTNLDDLDSIQEFDFNFETGTKVDLYIDNFVSIVKGAE